MYEREITYFKITATFSRSQWVKACVLWLHKHSCLHLIGDYSGDIWSLTDPMGSSNHHRAGLQEVTTNPE